MPPPILPPPPFPPTPPFDRPNLSPGGSLSAFIANQGDYFLYLTPYLYEKSSGDWTADVGIGGGFGLGSSRDLVAVEFNVIHYALDDFDRGGGLDLKVAHEWMPTEELRIGIAAGGLSVLSYGDAKDQGASAFLVSSLEFPIMFGEASRRMQINLGYGDNQFRDAKSSSLLDSGVFASAGIDIIDNLGISMGWSAAGFSTKLSFLPWRGTPLSIDMSTNNLTDHRDAGRSAVLSLTWGGNLGGNP